MNNRAILTLATWFAVGGLALSAGEFNADFKNPRELEQFAPETFFSLDSEGAQIADTGKTNPKEYRSASLRATPRLGGNVEVSCDFELFLFDHWNQFALSLVSAQKGMWSASLIRLQESAGSHCLLAKVSCNGKNTEKKIPSAIRRGTLKIRKNGTRVRFSAVDESGRETVVAEDMEVLDTACNLAVSFNAPPVTNQKVKISKLSAVWDQDDAPELPPPYQSDFRADDPAANYAVKWKGNLSTDGSYAGTANCLARDSNSITWNPAKSGKKQHRWGAVEFAPAFDGDFAAEADFDVAALDHWNGFRFSVKSLQKGRWSATLTRLQEKPGEEFFVASTKSGQEKREKKTPGNDRKFTMRLERIGSVMKFAVRNEKGESREIASFDRIPEGAVQLCINYDSPVGTNCNVRLSGLRMRAKSQINEAFAPAYAPLRKVADAAILFGENAVQLEDGSYKIAPNGRLIAVARCRLVSRGWQLQWKSQGKLRIEMIQPGSAETIKLGDAVCYDDIQDKVPEEYAIRRGGFENVVLRFPQERQWKLSHVTTDGIFFFEIAPAGKETVRFGEPELLAHELIAPPAFQTAVQTQAKISKAENGRKCLVWNVPGNQEFLSGAAAPKQVLLPCNGVPFQYNPTLLSEKTPSIEILFHDYAGIVHILHAAGKQSAGDSEVAAAYLLVYEDETTEPAFATLRWNCGVYGDGMLNVPTDAAITWWGPPRFSWGNILYLPYGRYGTSWNAFYRFDLVNPSPEKKIRSIIAYQMPGDKREFLLAGMSLTTPEETSVALIEPDRAAFQDGEELGLNFYEYRAVARAKTETLPMQMTKSADAAESIGSLVVTRQGKFGAGRMTFTPDSAKLGAGPVVFKSGGAESSRVSAMGRVSPNDKPFYYCMIGGGHEHIRDFDRMKRLGYDSIKVHIPWKLDEQENPIFSEWPERFARIDRAGLKVACRNLFSVPEKWREDGRIPKRRSYDGKTETEDTIRTAADTSNEFYRKKLVDYYARFGEVAKNAPNVVSINANYGQCNSIIRDGSIKYSAASLKEFGEYLKHHYTLAELNARTGLALSSFSEITPKMIFYDPTRTLLPAYSRYNEEVGSALMEEIARAIRSSGCKANFVFNVNFHPIENKMSGHTFGEYLRVGMKYAPGSLFHETSERYSLSFVKWLAAARTCGLPYGDECCQPPPTYEHLMFAYLWMGMMQSFESNYCQWWGGKPAVQNIAQLKAYHKLLYNAEYLPDPITLSLSLETGHDEICDTMKVPLHSASFSHYGLASLLRELNLNSDRYMIDEFPELDKNVKSKLIIDDHTRAMPKEFGDRLEKFIRAGGVYIASLDTDKLNGYDFLKRFGVTVENGAVSGASVTGNGKFRYAVKAAGQGKLVLYCGTYVSNWDPGRSPEEREFFYRLFTSFGGFKPLVSSSFADVFATPYRAANGDLLISCINITVLPREVEIGFARELMAEEPFTVRDLGSGRELEVTSRDGHCFVKVTVPEINTTVLQVSAKAKTLAFQE